MCFFELLATVAGQILQQQDEDALNARPLVDLEMPKINTERVQDNSTTYDLESDPRDVSGGTMKLNREDSITATKGLVQLSHTSGTCYEHSGNSSLEDGSDPLPPHKHYSKSLIKPIKAAYLPRKRKHSAALPGGRNKRQSDQCTSKAKSVPLHEEIPVHSRDLEETTIPNNENDMEQLYSSNVVTKFHEIDFVTPLRLDAESPPLVSSGSSEETPFSLKPKSYLTASSSRQNEGRDEFCSWKGGDEDGNSSESMAPNSFLTTSSDVKYSRAMKEQRSTSGTTKRRATGAGVKRKHSEMEDLKESPNAKVQYGRKKANKLLSKDIDQPTTNLPKQLLIDTKSEINVYTSPANGEGEKDTGVSSLATRSSTAKMEDTNVKLSIKSFTVPELMVALPESATIANLKKAVMEAAMKLLGGSLHVRVLLQGKKITDESKSLRQAGISIDGKLDSLDFMLEPNSFPTSSSVGDGFLVLSQNNNQQTLRYPALSEGNEINSDSFHVGTIQGKPQGFHEIDSNNSGSEMQSGAERPAKNNVAGNELVVPGPCALVIHPNQAHNSPNGLAVVPFSQNPAGVSTNKRRMRRPFSVAEVEVLVQAVEKLGTGRWRDVKLHAFPQAKHRTYVDLKDKWKTLVHTASIAPHQRRGEPVPQGLLDRVIQAHSYWTAQQAKQQTVELKIL
ncbi:hypothetical protein KP509_18G021500 [Ceratopteris richardii]|nr:hypothetical protein KP509_18G021500 [Ceratopteris richardii]